jgi:hydroxyquinol 1,2-dioxygenase
MGTVTESNLTDAVLAQIGPETEPRLREIMTSLIKHLHAFVRETELSEDEWYRGIQFLTRTGQQCNESRQEFILLSDALGVSMLVDAINHRKPSGATETTVLGPFYRPGAPARDKWGDIAEGVPGEVTYLHGRVLDLDGSPIAGAEVDVWQTDADGRYDQQLPELGGTMRLRGKFRTDAAGRYGVRTVRPVSYAIPNDGPVGKMLEMLGRHPYRPAHIHMIVSADGYEAITTHLFDDTDPHLESDAVFGVKQSLVVKFEPQPAGAVAPDGRRVPEPFSVVTYDFRLARS